MADLSLKGLDSELMKAVKVRAVEAGESLRGWVVKILTEAVNGDERGAAKGSVGSNYGEGGVDGGGAAHVQISDDEGRGLSKARSGSPKVRKLRGGVPNDTGNQGNGGSDGDAAVGGSFEGTSADTRAVGGSTQEDSVRVRETERAAEVWTGPAHMKGCSCQVCAGRRA